MKRPLIQFLILAGLLLTIAVSHPAYGQSPTPTGCPPTREAYDACRASGKEEQVAEQYILEQVKAGKPAKLNERFPDDTRRPAISACFITGLITQGVGAPQMGVVVQGATITGPFDLRNQEIRSHVEFINCVFKDEVNLKRSRFTKGLSLSASRFESHFDSSSATVDFDFGIAGSTFSNCRTLLINMVIAANLLAGGAKFLGDADFTGTRIGGTFDGSNTEYHGVADFEALKVGIDAGWFGAMFLGRVFFDTAEFKNFSIQQCSFQGDVSFRSTKMDNFFLSVGSAPGQVDQMFHGSLLIEDMSFQYMSPEDWGQLKAFAEASNTAIGDPNYRAYNAQFYATLESQFRRHGRMREADDVYIEGKKKERQSLSGLAWAWSCFEDGFIGYGRRFQRMLFVWSPLILLFFGFLPFGWVSRMETKKPEDAVRYRNKYSGILYSLDLFIPIVGLGYADVWTPKTPWRLYFFKPILTISGHLLVPIGLAAWTGIIR